MIQIVWILTGVISLGFLLCMHLLRRVQVLETARRRLPKRILLVRHGESEGNVTPELYHKHRDWHIRLTEKGWSQAIHAGHVIHKIIGNESVRFFTSPYTRTRETLNGISRAFGGIKNIEWQEEVLLREHETGDIPEDEYQFHAKKMMACGKFFYRFPGGESFADTYDRAYMFRDTLQRYFLDRPETENYVLISHATFTLAFLQRVVKFSVDDYNKLQYGTNCGVHVLESRGHAGDLLLARIVDTLTNTVTLPELGQSHCHLAFTSESKTWARMRTIREIPPWEEENRAAPAHQGLQEDDWELQYVHQSGTEKKKKNQ